MVLSRTGFTRTWSPVLSIGFSEGGTLYLLNWSPLCKVGVFVFEERTKFSRLQGWQSSFLDSHKVFLLSIRKRVLIVSFFWNSDWGVKVIGHLSCMWTPSDWLVLRMIFISFVVLLLWGIGDWIPSVVKESTMLSGRLIILSHKIYCYSYFIFSFHLHFSVIVCSIYIHICGKVLQGSRRTDYLTDLYPEYGNLYRGILPSDIHLRTSQ